jgi:hypothetical protein
MRPIVADAWVLDIAAERELAYLFYGLVWDELGNGCIVSPSSDDLRFGESTLGIGRSPSLPTRAEIQSYP